MCEIVTILTGLRGVCLTTKYEIEGIGANLVGPQMEVLLIRCLRDIFQVGYLPGKVFPSLASFPEKFGAVSIGNIEQFQSWQVFLSIAISLLERATPQNQLKQADMKRLLES